MENVIKKYQESDFVNKFIELEINFDLNIIKMLKESKEKHVNFEGKYLSVEMGDYCGILLDKGKTDLRLIHKSGMSVAYESLSRLEISAYLNRKFGILESETQLTWEILDDYGFRKEVTHPDHDDTEITYYLPNNVLLSQLSVISNESVKLDNLQGFCDYLEINTKEDLDKILTMTYEEVVIELADKHSDFVIEDWI